MTQEQHSVDLGDTIAPNSQQVNAEDLIGGARVVQVTSIEKGTADQPVFIHLAEFPGRTYRPAKSMRRVLVAAWGGDAANYPGRYMEIFNDPTVKWAGQEVGGIRISKLSHIDKPVTVHLTVTRGKRAPFTVQPLRPASQPLPAPDGWEDDVAACDTVEDLTEFYEMASAAGWWSTEVAAACTARKEALT
jgi:hypothetical protein